MASDNKSSNGKLRLKISSSSPKSVPPTPPPPPPTTTTGLTMNSPLVYNSISSLTPELQLFHEQVFKALPQSPHFNPLEHLKSENLKEGMKLGCDIAFLNLVMKFHNLVDPATFLRKVETFAEEFKEFEEMGYDLTKVKERFKFVKTKAEEEKELKDEAENLENEKTQREKKLVKKEVLLKELEEECARVAKVVEMERSEIEEIVNKKRKIMDVSEMFGKEFKKLGNSPWWMN